jgi:hypothetical protein
MTDERLNEETSSCVRLDLDESDANMVLNSEWIDENLQSLDNNQFTRED